MFSYRLALPALFMSLLLPLASPVFATEAEAEAQPKPAVREPLPERSQEDAAALERQVPQHEQQQLQAPGDSFLALWKPANSTAPQGAVIIIPGAGETADWPLVVGPLRNKLPDANWASLSLSLPDMQSEASQAREDEPEKTPTTLATDSSSKAASTTAKPIEQAASAGTESPEPEAVQNGQDLDKVDADRIFARIDAAIAFAQHQNMRTIVLLGHGSGDDNHRTVGVAAVGGFPQGEKTVVGCLQLLLLMVRQLSLKCGGFFLAALWQRLAHRWLGLGFGGKYWQGERQHQRQAQGRQCQTIRKHRLFQARSSPGSVMG